MPHVSYLSLHSDFVFGCFNNLMGLFDREVAYLLALLIGDLDFGQDTVAYRAENPDFITAFHEIVISPEYQ